MGTRVIYTIFDAMGASTKYHLYVKDITQDVDYKLIIPFKANLNFCNCVRSCTVDQCTNMQTEVYRSVHLV